MRLWSLIGKTSIECIRDKDSRYDLMSKLSRWFLAVDVLYRRLRVIFIHLGRL